jgi:hypothetical protein
MNSIKPISDAFLAIVWRFPTRVPHAPQATELELAGRDGTRQLLDRYVQATGSARFQELVARYRQAEPGAEENTGLENLTQAVKRAIHELES